MARNILAKYIWIIDTILQYGKLSKEQIRDLWMKSQYSDGIPLADRTFYNYRRAIESTFNIEILCTDSGYYYIESSGVQRVRNIINWKLYSSAASSAIQELGHESDRIEMEEVPSARTFLPTLAEAMRGNRMVVFTYAGFSRSRPEVGILFAPYFLKLYKQRWYMYGEKESGGIRTYALDRVTEMEIADLKFKMPRHLTAAQVFGDIVGITTTKSIVRTVQIQTNSTRAKYLRALPLHHSQQEEVHDFYSIFSYRVKLNYELVSEIMAMGPDVTVIAPRELQLMVIDRLRSTLSNYSQL